MFACASTHLPQFPFRSLRAVLPALLLFLLGLQVAPLEAANTPVTPVPQDRWGALKPTAILGDSSSFAFNYVPNADGPFFEYDVDVENGWVFATTGKGIAIWDARTTPGQPTLSSRVYAPSVVPDWHQNDTKYYLYGIDAPAGNDSVVAVAAINYNGILIFDTSSKTAPRLVYQDDNTEGKEVWATTIGGTAYAFFAAGNQKVLVYNMTKAQSLSSACADETGGIGQINCPGVKVGKIPAASGVSYVGGTGHFVALTQGSNGIEIWNVANPASPVEVMSGAPAGSPLLRGVAMWQASSKYYLGVLDANTPATLRIFDVSCIASGSCSLGSPISTFSAQSTDCSGTTTGYSVVHLSTSTSNGTPYLYLGGEDAFSGGVQREWLLDVSNPSKPTDVTPPVTCTATDKGGYWGWYYPGNSTGFTNVNPRFAQMWNGYLYRAAYSLMDVHQYVGSVPPTADFTWSPSTIYPGQTVSFSDTSAGAPTSWEWDFNNDGIIDSTQQDPTHIYTQSDVTNACSGTYPCTFRVNLTVTNSKGSNSTYQNVTVTDPAPAVSSVTPSLTTVYQCQPVTFTASATGQPTLKYSWQVENSDYVALTTPYSFPTTPSASATSYTWDTTNVPQTGVTYYGHVFVTSTGNAASTDMRSVAVTVNPLDPLPNDNFTLPPSTCTNCTAVAALGPPAGVVDVSAPSETGVTAWRWNFGDGTGWTPWSSDPTTGPNTSHTYTAIGNYDIQLQVENCKTGPATSAKLSVAIQNLITLKASFAPVCALGSCIFSSGDLISFADSSTGPPTTWYYDWNNTSSSACTASDPNFDAGHSSPVTTHTYTVPTGTTTTFYPCLKVTGGGQTSYATSRGVSVSNVTYTPPPTPSPSISVSGPTSAAVDTTVTFSASASSCSPSASGWTWSVDGGTVSGSSTSSGISVKWSAAGTKSVTAKNSACGSASGYKSISITSTGGGGGGGGGGTCGAVGMDNLQACFSYSPSPGSAGSPMSFDGTASAGSPTLYYWVFGDGTTSTTSTPTPTHTYAKDGTYSVSLHVSKLVSGSNCGLGSGICEAVETQSVTIGAGTSPSASRSALIRTAPAATLLLPYWEVDLDNPTNGRTTLFSVTNTDATPHLARVTLWTDWGIPTLSFDIYLTGNAVQTFNMRDLLNGNLPTTGPVTDNRGYGSEKWFTGCPGSQSNLQDLATLKLTSDQIAALQAEHLGDPATLGSASNMCAAFPATEAGLAVGYATVDVESECALGTVPSPASSGYFVDGGKGVATDDNVLVGDYYLVDPANNAAQGEILTAVHADPATFTGGVDTFYSRLVGGSGADNREPLPSHYTSRYLAGGAFDGGTSLTVWRGLPSGAGTVPIACTTNQQPSWAPLADSSFTSFDEDGSGSSPTTITAMTGATQRDTVGGSSIPTNGAFGRFTLDVGDGGTSNAATTSTTDESMVTSMFTALGRYSVGMSGSPLDGPAVDAATRQACDANTGPAATLLIPYFEVDEANSDGPNTYFAVANTDSVGHLANVTLWTDWAIPTLSFDIYLPANGVQTFGMRDVLAGNLPSRAPASGDTSLSAGVLSACVANGKMVLPAVDPNLAAKHEGQNLDNQCYGESYGDKTARGYVTIDVVNECSSGENPSSANYFVAGGTGVASDQNVLVGDFFYVDSANNYAQGDSAVGIHATPGAFLKGDYTFYGRYVNGDASDDRQPLGQKLNARYLAGPPFNNADLIVWRDTKSPNASPVTCGRAPSWAPLSETLTSGFSEGGTVLFSSPSRYFPLATQKVPVNNSSGLFAADPGDFGHIVTNLGFTNSSKLFNNADQGWMLQVSSALGEYSAALPGDILVPICHASGSP